MTLARRAIRRAFRQQVEDWDKLAWLRVGYAGGREVEYVLTTPDWVAEPLDESPAQVIAGEITPWFDRDRYLSSHIDLGEA